MDRFDFLKLKANELPPLETGEVEICIQDRVGLYHGTEFNDGIARLTNYRLLWITPSSHNNDESLMLRLVFISKIDYAAGFVTTSPKILLHLRSRLSISWSCPQCTFENGPGMDSCLQCRETVPFLVPPRSNWTCARCTYSNLSVAFRCELCAAPAPPLKSRFHPPSDYVKLSFRGGGQSEFFEQLRHVLAQPTESRSDRLSEQSTKNQPTSKFNPTRAGIAAVLRSVDETQRETDAALTEAFRDLDALMVKASEMVKIAERITAKTVKDAPESDAQHLKSYLLSLGVQSPVSRELSPTTYFVELARQLSEFLARWLPQCGGIVSLIDLYGLYNRARGTALISPEDLYRACTLFEELDLPVMLCRFASGVLAIQLRSIGENTWLESVDFLLQERNFITAIELAKSKGIAVSLAKEELLTLELTGRLCRDETIEGTRYYRNIL